MVTKAVIGNRIKALRLEKGLSQESFGEPIGLSKSALSQIESGQTYPSLETLDKIVKHYLISWEQLIEGNLLGNLKGNLKGNPIAKTKDQKLILAKNEPDNKIRHLIVTANPSGRENITLVPVKAQAGYLIGSGDKEYIEHLPQFWLPGLSNGTFRAFEVSGYSMLADRIGFFPGDIVIGEWVDKLADIKDGQVYVIVNNAQDVDDIVLKRCLNYMDKGGVIICKSDNKDPQYPTFPLQAETIKEVWRFKMKLTRQAPEPSGLYERMNGIEGEVVLLKEKLNNLFDLRGI